VARSDETDAVAGERRQLLIQVEHGAAKAINLPRGNAVELPLGSIGHKPTQCGPTGFGPGETSVHVLPGDLPVTV
jgi:hypothetical protein